LILHLLAFSPSAGKEEVPQPVWHTEIDVVAPRTEQETGNSYWFRVGDVFGYFDADGRILHTERVLYDVTMSDRGYINYSRIPRNLVLKDSTGHFIRSYQHTGYPILNGSADRISFLHQDSTGFTTIDLESEEAWQREFATIVTSLSMNQEKVLVGLLNGVLKLYNGKGEELLEVQIPGSRIPVVFGCALGDGGRHMAAVGGLDPQKLVFIRIKDNGEPTVFDWPLAGDLRREVFVSFGTDGRYVFFEGKQEIGVFRVSKRQFITLPIRGRLLGFANEERRGFVFLVSGDAGEKRLFLYSLHGSLLLREPIQCRNVFLRHVDGHIILGCDRRLIRIDIERE
jgi:hypothetical protein